MSHSNLLLDLRLSTFEQLQHKLGKENVFCIDSEGMKYPEIFYPTLNLFLIAASKELPNAQVIQDTRPSIAFGNKNYDLHNEDQELYVADMQVLKDFNFILEAVNSQKRFFYFNDSGDNDMNCSYFYCDKEFGLELINFLNDPPDYSIDDFEDRSVNRNINMQLVDSAMERKGEYFVRMFPDF